MENEDNDIKIENEKDERETAKKSHSKKILIVVLFIFMAAAGTYFGINGGDTEKMAETALKIKAAVLQLGKNGGGKFHRQEAKVLHRQRHHHLLLRLLHRHHHLPATAKKMQ